MIEKIQIMSGDFYESLEGMNYESVGRLFMGLMAYANDKDPKVHLGENVPALTLYPVMKTHIERHEEFRRTKAENGRKGGGQFGNANATKNDLKQPKTTKNDQKRTPIPIPNPIPNPNNNKRPYGEFVNVFLTDDEYQKIKDKGLEGLINELSSYISSKGVKYKSHYATIVSWANRRKDESKPKDNNFTQGARTKDYDFEEILKRKQVN